MWRRVGGYLGYLNREVLRPVTLSVHVYSVRRSRGADYELGLSVVIERLLGSPLQLAAGADSVAVIKPGVVGEDTFSAAVDAMNQAGTASRVLSADIPSLNGKPAQFFELFNEAYLREQRTTISDGVAQTELVPGRVSSGFAVSYLPRITGPGEVLVRLFASLQDRPVFTVFTSANPVDSITRVWKPGHSGDAEDWPGRDAAGDGFLRSERVGREVGDVLGRFAAAKRGTGVCGDARGAGAVDYRRYRGAAWGVRDSWSVVLNVLTFGKRSFAVGLHWMERGSKAAAVAHAVSAGAPYFVDWEKQTGFLSGEPETPEGLPALSLALLQVVPEDFFMALVQSDEGAYALVRGA